LEAAEYWCDDTTEQLLFGGAKAGGKSFLGASLIFGDALIYPETQYYIARQELIDLRKFTIPTIYEVFQKWGIKADDYMKFKQGANKFRILSAPIMGWEYWTESKKPVRPKSVGQPFQQTRISAERTAGIQNIPGR
jgi:hypothetical protein